MAGVRNVKPKCYIIALFIRDDSKRLVLGSGAYEFVEKQMMFAPNTIVNDTVDVQGNDGVLLAGQVRRASTQSFDGYIGDATFSKVTVETARRQFLEFFRRGHKYTVVYVFPNGTAVKRQRGFLVDAPSVQELWQIHPEYHVALNFEDVNYYTYNEDGAGQETYGQTAILSLYNAVTGGLVWDNLGVVWDDDGATWNPGVGGTTTINVNSIETVYPIWTTKGLAENPRIENLTTGGAIQYNGRVAPGSTLVVDMLNQTATLNGTNVLPNISGDWLYFASGVNRVNYITDNDNAPQSTIQWQEVVF